MTQGITNRQFVLLRYTLIIATAYLVVVEGNFVALSVVGACLIALALASNVAIALLPPALTSATTFTVAVIMGDTVWITALLLYTGKFDAEFFYLYFFVLLLAAIGESLLLISIGTVVVCMAYVYLLMRLGGGWWSSPSLIRIPFLFAAGVFYGHLIDRTRTERRRAELEEHERARAEQALAERTEQLGEEAAVSAALARIGEQLISSLDTPVLLDLVCQLAATELEAASSQTLLRREEPAVYVPVATFGMAAEEREFDCLSETRERLEHLLSALEHEDIVEAPAGALESSHPEWLRRSGTTRQLFMALRQGKELTGIQVANWRGPTDRCTPTQRRIAAGIAHMASVALMHARLIDELDAANRLKSEFVASISHELRTPLNLIIGYNDLLLDSVFGALNAEQADTLRRVSKSSRELLELIEATLDLSRLQSQRTPLDLCDVASADLLAEVAAETRASCRKPGVEFTWITPDREVRTYTDAVKLKMVLKNLIGNAVKFTEQGQIRVSASSADGWVAFEVADTGIGIAPEAHDRIFEPFRQADQSISTRYGGTGLGLYVVRRLLEMLGGSISVQSELGRGATFRVRLPEHVQPPSKPPVLVPAVSPRRAAMEATRKARQSVKQAEAREAARLECAPAGDARHTGGGAEHPAPGDRE